MGQRCQYVASVGMCAFTWMVQLYEISFENIGNIGISAITNIGVSAYRQKCHIGTPLLSIPHGKD